MIEHYNAFISYKHAEEDIKVAEAVQHSLEHFHIPGKIRKKTGMKRIERIFRDKEELPITSDLSENIAYALEHSDYLIVICSTNTKQSMWVPREIEYFLRNHSKKQILTVLVNGEPQDVIPDILLHEERIVTDYAGNQQTIRVPLEPLSCDYRSSIKKANKTEIPRLASALIGCSYDELMNRQRQYKMRRMTLAFSLILAIVLGFSGQMIYSRYKIKQNYLDSLKNQSRYLANESEQFLEKEQRITAIQLALAALPDGKNDERPVTAEALRAITNATLAYKSIAGNNIYAAWNYSMPNRISDYTLSPDGTYLAALDAANFIRVWEIASHNICFELSGLDESIYGFSFTSDDRLLVWTSTSAYLYDANDGSKLWSYKVNESSFRYDVMTDADGNIIISLLNGSLVLIDASNGEEIKKYTIPSNENDYTVYADFVLSPDKKTAAFSGNCSIDNYFVGTIDLNTGKTEKSEIRESRIKKIYWADNSHIMAAYSENDMNSNVTMQANSYLSTDHTYIQCLDKNTLTELWNYDFTSNEVNIYDSFLALPENNYVAFCNGNMAGIFDLNSGELLYNHNVNSSIVDMSDRDGDGWPVYITSEGGFASPSPSSGSDSLTLTDIFTDNLDKAIVKSGVYVHQSDSKDIIFYGLYVSDTEWTEINEDLIIGSVWDSFYMEDNVLSIISDSDTAPVLTVINPENNEVNQISLTDDTLYSQYNLLGIWNGKLYMAFSNYSSAKIISVDLATMNTAEYELDDSYTPDAHTCIMENGKIIFYLKRNLQYAVAIYDIDSKETSAYPMPDGFNPGQNAPFYIEATNKIYVTGNSSDYVIDINSEETTPVSLPENYGGTTRFAVLDANEYAISDNNSIVVINEKFDIKFTILCPGIEPLGMAYYKKDKSKNNELLVAYGNGSLYRYNADNGSFIGMTEISTYANAKYSASFDFDYDNNLLYIQTGLATDIIDLNSMIETTCIENCLGHNVPTDRFYTLSYTKSRENHIGYFKHYTTEELIQKGKDILQGAGLTDEQKSKYGIK